MTLDTFLNKTPLQTHERREATFNTMQACLIFQTICLPELAPVSLQNSGCRGFTGPVPPPLWMRVWAEFTTGA
jgi:hypothetical protein